MPYSSFHVYTESRNSKNVMFGRHVPGPRSRPPNAYDVARSPSDVSIHPPLPSPPRSLIPSLLIRFRAPLYPPPEHHPATPSVANILPTDLLFRPSTNARSATSACIFYHEVV
ncbi:hypothetical protein BJ912DRAFT_1068671 [Pholiota molesta]|nr:hypothetical protein BJ912DRAFT_1068671 [Pholiota molesta]